MVTPENFILKLGTRDYIDKVTYYTIFDVDRFTGGFIPNRWNITLLWLFSCPVGLLSFFLLHTQLEPRGRYSWFMAQMTWFRPRTVRLGVRTMSDIFGGKCAPKIPQKGAWKGVFKPKSQNTKTCILSKLPHRFQPNFAQWQRLPNALRGWSNHSHNKSKMADGRHLWKIGKSTYLGRVLTDFDHVTLDWFCGLT